MIWWCVSRFWEPWLEHAWSTFTGSAWSRSLQDFPEVEGSSAHTNQDHLRTQPRIMCTHKSVSSAHTDQDHLRTRIRTPNQSSSVRWGGVGIITNLAALHGPDNYTGQTFLSTNIFLWVGWGGAGGGVGWGGDNNKPCRFTRTWQLLHRADFPSTNIFLWVGWGGVGWG